MEYGMVIKTKSVLMSVRPKMCRMIVDGMENVLIRKSCPREPVPFRVCICCTKGKDILLDILRDGDMNYGEIYHGETVFIKAPEDTFGVLYSGKVIGEFVCDECKPIAVKKGEIFSSCPKDWRACITQKEFLKYVGDTGLVWAWHISGLKVYDKPRKIEEFGINRPPQGWRYIE